MIIEMIMIKNWLAFKGEHFLALPSGPISVVAQYETNSARSNWAGKTAFLESISWCLFGIHRKRYEDDVIFEGEDNTEVHLFFDTGFEVRRSRKRGKTSKLLVAVPTDTNKKQWSEKKLAESLIEKELGFDADDFNATVCFSQGDTEAIVNRTSGERRKIISQWLELDVWQRVYSRARSHVKNLVSEYDFKKKELEQIKNQITTLSQSDWLILRNEAVQFRDRRSEELKSIDEELEKMVRHHEMKETYDLYNSMIFEAKLLKKELTNTNVEGLEETRNELNMIKEELSVNRFEYMKKKKIYDGGFTGRCPVIQKQCPVKDQIVLERTSIFNCCKEAEAKYEKCIILESDKEKKLSDLERLDVELMKKRERFKFLVRQIKQLKPKADLFKNMPKLSDQYMYDLRVRRDELRTRISEKDTEIFKYDTNIQNLSEFKETCEKLETWINEQEKRIKIANFVMKATSSTGVPSYVAESILLKLEERTNVLLSNSGLIVSFSFDRETRDLTPSCYECGYLFKGKRDKICPSCQTDRGMKRADELEILVDDGSGVLEDIKMKSGGARALVASSIRLAAGLMLKELRNSRCAFSIIDEPFGALDSENRRSLTNVFSGMLSAVGLEQAFIVSHDTELLDSLPGRILIVRKDNYSTITLVQ